MSSSGQHRKQPSRAALPRRSTKGPLDAIEDALAITDTASSSLASSGHIALPFSPQDERTEPLLHVAALQTRREPSPARETTNQERDLSFLLDAAIYHPLSQVEVPGPFRKPFLPPPSHNTPVSQSLEQLDSLLSQCEFLRAAHFAAMILTSGTLRPTDTSVIFRLLGIRYSCLELTGNSLFAAQEAKALEDLSSAFYYDDPNPTRNTETEEDNVRKVPTHIMPFPLRLQALRLQSLGFSDPRRGVSTLYDTASECREHLASAETSPEQRSIWAEHLQEVSIRVVNTLIEMGELDCAARTLETLKPRQAEGMALWEARRILLHIKMGDITKARGLAKSSHVDPQERLALEALLGISDGRYKEVTSMLAESDTPINPTMRALVQQNLALAHLYDGYVKKARMLLEELVEDGCSFQSLTINLATIYDLTSDRSRDLKTAMISKIASHQSETPTQRAFVNADFKL